MGGSGVKTSLWVSGSKRDISFLPSVYQACGLLSHVTAMVITVSRFLIRFIMKCLDIYIPASMHRRGPH